MTKAILETLTVMTQSNPKPGTELIVTSAGSVLPTPRRRVAVRRQRVPKPVGLSTLSMTYQSALVARSKRIRTEAAKLLPPLLESATGQVENALRLDALTEDVELMVEGLKAVYLKERSQTSLEAIIERHGQKVNARSLQNFRRQYKSVMGVDVLSANPWLKQEVKTFTAENVSLITSIEESNLKSVEQIVFRKVNAGERPGAIADELQKMFELSDSRAQLIARDQTLKFHSRLLRRRYTDIGLTRYRWRTVGDVSVRQRHQALNGKVFSFDDPPVTVTSGSRAGERNNPGEDIQCRCFAEPIFDDLFKAA